MFMLLKYKQPCNKGFAIVPSRILAVFSYLPLQKPTFAALWEQRRLCLAAPTAADPTGERMRHLEAKL